MINLFNNNNKANIISSLLIKCKKITKNILIFKFYTIIYRFNIKAILKSNME